ncbi:restriction endonuclease subunit S [Corynebacterium sp. LK2537]|uniref:restriction endonuclease subunit S n=1 Tax=Corynebacterium sp. LK2537 TaxID=3110471 RepID=UPI0034D021FD
MRSHNVPALRLEGFDGEWEAQRAREIFIETDDRGYPDLPVLSATQTRGMVPRSMVDYTIQHNRANEVGYKRVCVGDFVVHLRSFQGGFAHSYYEGITSPAYHVFRARESSRHDHKFWRFVFASSHFIHQLHFVTFGIRDGKSISFPEFLELPLNYAPTLEEQQAIGAIFTNLDAAINQHTLKHKALQQAKTALMQRMFPQEGQTLPELRLDGFSGEWEETTLGELGAFRSGVGFPEREQGGTIGLPFYKVSDLSAPGNELQLQSANHYVTEGQIVRNHWTSVTAVPAILFAKVGAAVFLGRKRLVNNAFLLDNNLMAFSLNTESWDVQFADTYLKTVDLTQFTQSGALPSLNARHLAEAEAIIPPTLEEQQAIGAVFTNLDQLIAAEAQYIASLKQAKTALLQRMFI